MAISIPNDRFDMDVYHTRNIKLTQHCFSIEVTFVFQMLNQKCGNPFETLVIDCYDVMMVAQSTVIRVNALVLS